MRAESSYPEKPDSNPAITSSFFKETDLFFVRIHKLVLNGFSYRKGRVKRSMMFISSLCHLMNKRFMSQVKSFELSSPTHRFWMMSISFLIIGDYRPESM